MSRFTEGDILEIRGHKHEVVQVDFTLSDKERVIQYRLEPIGDAPPATLSPGNGKKEEKYAIKEFYEVLPEDIDVVEE